MAAEARIAARFGGLVRAGGGTPAGAEVAASALVREGATALVSFGLAGGLDPALRPGALLVPSFVLSEDERLPVDAGLAERFGGVTGHTVLAGRAVVTDAAGKRRLFEATGAYAVDLESGAVAGIARAHGIPFVVVRAICDPAERDLPPAALLALDPSGGIGLGTVIGSVLRGPAQIWGLIRLAGDVAAARRALVGAAGRFRAG